MAKVMFVLGLLSLLAINSVIGLKCYSCLDCDTVDDNTKICNVGTTSSTSTTPALTTTETTKQNGGSSRTATDERELKWNCIKIITEAEGVAVTSRNCISQTCEQMKNSIESAGKGIQVTCAKECDTDLCNPAPHIQSWTLSSVVIVAIIKMFL